MYNIRGSETHRIKFGTITRIKSNFLEATLSAVLDECERLRTTLTEKSDRIKTLEHEIQQKTDDLMAKSLELHRLDTIGSILEESVTDQPESMVIEAVIEKTFETPKTKKRPKPKSKSLPSQTSLKGYLQKDTKKQSRKSNQLSPKKEWIRDQELETMFDEDETLIDNALDIYRGKSISPQSADKTPSRPANHEADEDDATSPIIEPTHKRGSTRLAKDLLFGSQDSDDDIPRTSRQKGGKLERKKRTSDGNQEHVIPNTYFWNLIITVHSPKSYKKRNN
mgnify:CR=1 FL=1